MTEHIYLKELADNLEVGLNGLQTADGNTAINRVQKYLFPYPTEPTWACIHMWGASVEIILSGGPRRQNQRWYIPIRIGVGALG